MRFLFSFCFFISSTSIFSQVNDFYVVITEDLILLINTVSTTSNAYNYKSDAELLRSKDSKYEYNHNKVDIAYGNILRLQLINDYNKKILEDYKVTLKSNISVLSTYDFSYEEPTSKAISYINDILNFYCVSNEVNLLKDINKEILYLKSINQFNSNSKRYREILNLLNELKTAGNTEICKLGKKYGFVNLNCIEKKEIVKNEVEQINQVPKIKFQFVSTKHKKYYLYNSQGGYLGCFDENQLLNFDGNGAGNYYFYYTSKLNGRLKASKVITVQVWEGVKSVNVKFSGFRGYSSSYLWK